MQRKGSITVFFTLLLSIVISLLGTLLVSAKIAAGRTQIATAADLAMFSAMAKYDRALFDEYHLFYIDGGFGTETLQLGKALDEIELDMSYLLTPNKEREYTGGKNFLQLEKISGSISGYTLATDCNGSVFYEQAISYMEETLGLQGITLLSQKLQKEKDLITDQKNTWEIIERRGALEDYVKIKKDAENISENDELKETQEDQITEKDRENAQNAESIIETASAVKTGSLLKLTVPDTSKISDYTGQENELFRNRKPVSGMGYLELTRDADSLTDAVLFQEYIMQNLNYYGEKRHDTGPAYGIEWILFEKTSDIENLETAINRIMLIREAANAVALRSDINRYRQVQSIAESLAAVLKSPGLQYILEGILILAWAYAESIVDMRGLLEGKTVPLVKYPNSWQVEFLDILPAIQSPSAYYKENEGMSYQDYLRIMLFMKSKEEKINGCMEVIELSIREMPGKNNFSMSCAIDSLETEFKIRSERLMTFTICEKRCYRTM